MCDLYTPVYVLFRFAKSNNKLTFQTLFGDLGGPRVPPETRDNYQNGAQAPYKESAKNEKENCQKLEGNVASEGKMSINTLENVKSDSRVFVKSATARRRPRLSRKCSKVALGRVWGGILGLSAQEKQPERRTPERRDERNSRAKGRHKRTRKTRKASK